MYCWVVDIFMKCKSCVIMTSLVHREFMTKMSIKIKFIVFENSKKSEKTLTNRAGPQGSVTKARLFGQTSLLRDATCLFYKTI